MASSRCRQAGSFFILLVGLASGAGCSVQPATGNHDSAVLVGPEGQSPGIDLPAGAARDVMLRACLGCHDLGGINLFKGFYGRSDWHTLVQTMVAHGAAVNAAEVELISDYLAEHFSPR